MRPPRWLALPAGLLVAVLAGAASFGPFVRAQIETRAERLGATVSVERVRPSWNGVRLEGLSVQLADLPGTAISLEQVEIDASLSGAIHAVHAHGMAVRATASLDSLRTGLDLLGARVRSPAPGTHREGVALSLDHSSISWETAGQRAHVAELAVRRGEAGWLLNVGTLDASREGASVEGRSLAVELAHEQDGWKVAALRADALSAVLPMAISSEPAAARDRAAAPEPKAPLSARVAAAKERLHAAATAAAGFIKPGATVHVLELRAEIRKGEDVLHAGPGVFRVESEPAKIHVSFAPSGELDGGGASPLRLQTEIPFDRSSPIAASLSGGPVTLAMLGVQERDMGLLDVAKATVEASGKVSLSGDGARTEIDLQGKLRGVSIEHPKLSTEPVRGLDLQFSVAGAAALDGSEVKLERGEVELGSVRAELTGELERASDRWTLRTKYSVPLASCQAVLDAMPSGLLPRLRGVKMSGTFALNGGVAFDSKKPAEARVDFNLMNECRVSHAPPEIHVGRLRQPFRRKVYAPDGARVEIDSGPGTPGWVSFGGISPYMEAAVLTTEDGGFRRHRGFDLEAIRNSIRENLKAGRFVRGASTISMQTAKNVYLERDKTLSRKLQEALLTSYLEQELSKEQILELYLNSIEFGPMIYGVSAAAAHYFKTTPSQLSLGQALYLSSILPNPKQQHFGPDGKVTPGFMAYLHKLMRHMAKKNLIRDDELKEGLSEWVQFGVPNPPKMENIVGAGAIDGDAAAWDDRAGAP